MVVGILKTIELEPGDELVAVNWHVSRSMNFKEIVARSENDTTNLRVIVFSDITPKYGEEWYGRAMIRTRLRGWGTWISVDIITLNREDSLNNIVALPSPISLPNLITTKYALIKDRNPKTDIGHSNHPLTNFYLNAENSFKTIGDAKLVATSWWIEDVNDQVVWKRLFDTKNLYSVKFSGLLLEREKIYRARAVFHSNTQDSSDPSSYRFKTIGDYNYALRVFLENQFFNKLNNPGFDEEGTPIPHPLDTGFNFTLPYEPTVTDRWIEIHKVENGDISEVFKVHLTDGNRDVNIAPGTLEKNAEYLIFFKTKEDDPLDTIVLNTYEYNYEEVLPEGEPDTPDHDITNPVPDTPIKLWCKQMAEVGEEVHIVATGTYKLVNFTFVPNSVTVVDKTMHKVTIRLNKMEDVKVIASGMGIPEVSRTIKVGARQEAADTPQVDTGSGGPTDVTYHPDKNTYNPGDRVVVVGPFGSQGVFLNPETGGKVTEIAPGVFEVVFGDNLGQVSISVLPGFNRDKTIEIVAKQEISVTPQEPTDRPITYVPSKDTYDYNDKIIVTGPAGTTGIELEPASHLADVVEIGDGVFEITIKHPTDLTPVFKPSNKKGDVIKTTKDDDLYLDLLHINLGDFLYKYCTDFDYARRKTGYVLSGNENMFTEQTFLNKIKEVNFLNHRITNASKLSPLDLPVTWGCLINNAFIPFFDKEYFKENVVREDGDVDWGYIDEKDPTIKAKYRLVDPDKHWDKIKELNTKMVRDRDQAYADNFLNNDRWGLLDIKGLITNKRTASLKNAKEYLSKLARSTMGMSYVTKCSFALEEKFAREHPQAYYEILNYVDIDEQGNYGALDPKTKHPKPYKKLVELVTASDGNYRNGAFQPGGNYSNGVIHEYLKFISTHLATYHAISGFYHNGVVNNIDNLSHGFEFTDAALWIMYYDSKRHVPQNHSELGEFRESVPMSLYALSLLWRFLPKQSEPPKIPEEVQDNQEPQPEPEVQLPEIEPNTEILNMYDLDFTDFFNYALSGEDNIQAVADSFYTVMGGVSAGWEQLLNFSTRTAQTDLEKKISILVMALSYLGKGMRKRALMSSLPRSKRPGFNYLINDPEAVLSNINATMKQLMRKDGATLDPDEFLDYDNVEACMMSDVKTDVYRTEEKLSKLQEQKAKETEIINNYLAEGQTLTTTMSDSMPVYHLLSLLESNEVSNEFKTEMVEKLKSLCRTLTPTTYDKSKLKNYKFTPAPGQEVVLYEPSDDRYPLYINPFKLNMVNLFSRLVYKEEELDTAMAELTKSIGSSRVEVETMYHGLNIAEQYGRENKSCDEDAVFAKILTAGARIFKMAFFKADFGKTFEDDTEEGYYKWKDTNDFIKKMKKYGTKYALAESFTSIKHTQEAWIFSLAQLNYYNAMVSGAKYDPKSKNDGFDGYRLIWGAENVDPYVTNDPKGSGKIISAEDQEKSYFHPRIGAMAIMNTNIDSILENWELDRDFFIKYAPLRDFMRESFSQKYEDPDLRYGIQVYYQQKYAQHYYTWMLPIYRCILQTWKSINAYKESKGQAPLPELEATRLTANVILQDTRDPDPNKWLFRPKLDIIKARPDSLDKEIFPD